MQYGFGLGIVYKTQTDTHVNEPSKVTTMKKEAGKLLADQLGVRIRSCKGLQHAKR